MNLDQDHCYAALVARDRRFDGVFFVGVTSTGIYCRPVCTARRPRRDRCRFFAHGAAAEREGFRPCLRCRPELAPGLSPMDRPGRIAWTAIRRMRMSPSLSAARVAAEIGLSERQMRRLIVEHLGVSPVEFTQTARLLLAKQLLTETGLPVSRVATAAGFGSLRRLNHLFRERLGVAPTDFRRSAKQKKVEQGGLCIRLAYRPPLAWGHLIKFLRDHAVPGVEVVEGGAYSRTLRVDRHVGWLSVEPDHDEPLLWLRVSESLVPVISSVIAGVRALCDLDARPDVVDQHLETDSALAPSVRSVPGLRVPGAIDGFELLWRTVLGQQVSVKGATTLSGRVAKEFGEPIVTPIVGLTHLTPTARAVAAVKPDALMNLGITSSRAACVIEVAKAMAGGLRIEPGVAPDEVGPRLRAIRGIGPWTESYVAMRGLAWPDAIPETDLFVRRALERLPARSVEAWKPWRSYAVMHLWNMASIQT